MNYTKNIDKKIKYRENLIAEYNADIDAARNAIEAIQSEISAASEAGNYKLVATKERLLRTASDDLSDAETALEMAMDKEKISLELIRDEWERGPHAEYLERRAKADQAIEKAFEVFSKAIKEAAKISEECENEGEEYRDLINEESKPGEIPGTSFIDICAGVYSPTGIFKDYAIKFEQMQPVSRW